VRRHGHDRSRAVLAEDEIRNPDRDLLIRERVDGPEAGVESLLLDVAADSRGAPGWDWW